MRKLLKTHTLKRLIAMTLTTSIGLMNFAILRPKDVQATSDDFGSRLILNNEIGKKAVGNVVNDKYQTNVPIKIGQQENKDLLWGITGVHGNTANIVSMQSLGKSEFGKTLNYLYDDNCIVRKKVNGWFGEKTDYDSSVKPVLNDNERELFQSAGVAYEDIFDFFLSLYTRHDRYRLTAYATHFYLPSLNEMSITVGSDHLGKYTWADGVEKAWLAYSTVLTSAKFGEPFTNSTFGNYYASQNSGLATSNITDDTDEFDCCPAAMLNLENISFISPVSAATFTYPVPMAISQDPRYTLRIKDDSRCPVSLVRAADDYLTLSGDMNKVDSMRLVILSKSTDGAYFENFKDIKDGTDISLTAQDFVAGGKDVSAVKAWVETVEDRVSYVSGEPIDVNVQGEPVVWEGKYWVENGATMTKISPYRKINWLKEESDGTSAWYGIQDPDHVLKDGSTFHVQWYNSGNVSQNEQARYDEIYNDLDYNHQKMAERGDLWLFDMGVTDPDGYAYKYLPKNVYVYVELGDDWSANDIEALYVSKYEDEHIFWQTVYDPLKTSDGTELNKVACLTIPHFSAYALYDKTSAATGVATGDDYTIVAFALSNLTIGVVLWLMYEKKLRKI